MVIHGKYHLELRIDSTGVNNFNDRKTFKKFPHISLVQFAVQAGRCKLMITTQLTGCCMVFDPSGTKVAHVWSDEGENGIDLRDRLAVKNPTCKLYGRKDFKESLSSVVGVRMDEVRYLHRFHDALQWRVDGMHVQR